MAFRSRCRLRQFDHLSDFDVVRVSDMIYALQRFHTGPVMRQSLTVCRLFLHDIQTPKKRLQLFSLIRPRLIPFQSPPSLDPSAPLIKCGAGNTFRSSPDAFSPDRCPSRAPSTAVQQMKSPRLQLPHTSASRFAVANLNAD